METKIKAWVIIDKKNIGVIRASPALFYDINHKFHIFKTRKDARKYIDKQFFNAKDMGWRVIPIKITI